MPTPRTLTARWSRAAKHGRHFGARGDLILAWGEECAPADAHLLHDVLSSERPRLLTCLGPHPTHQFDPSLLAELDRRGYDLTTLRVSIRKKPPAPDGAHRTFR